MFENKLQNEHIRAAGAYELAKHSEAGCERIAYSKGYMEAILWAKEAYEELFDPPMSDEGYLSSQAAELIKMTANA